LDHIPLGDSVETRNANRLLVGRRVLRYKSVPSTQDIALELASQHTQNGTVVLAGEQVAGRGRFQRSWKSPLGASVNLSVVLYMSHDIVSRLSISSAVAVVRVIKRVAGLDAHVKWPNDLRVNGRKVCGILVEGQMPVKGDATAILGVGVNVDWDLSGYPELADVATGLVQECGHSILVSDVEEELLNELDRICVSRDNDDRIFKEWRQNLDTLGHQVEVRWRDSIERGMAEDVDPNGNLILRRFDGSAVTLSAGEITLQY
jgi:BirA family biotin operon repressor/biotin-[acetyl-CoA-carboxylase] ligase